jgi:hypothetical protein
VVGPHHPDTLASRNNHAGANESQGRWAEAEPLRRDILARRRKTTASDRSLLARDLAGTGRNLLMQAKWTEAESVLRECLAIRAKAIPDDWSRFNTMSLLGGALLGQAKYAAAEPLVVAAYEGMKQHEETIPLQGKIRLTEAIERLIQLYEAWGQPEKAAAWKVKLGLTDLPDDVFARP